MFSSFYIIFFFFHFICFMNRFCSSWMSSNVLILVFASDFINTSHCSLFLFKVARTIKRARNYGLLSHLGQSVLINMRPAHHDKILHDNANPKNVHMSGSQGLVQTKTIDWKIEKFEFKVWGESSFFLLLIKINHC